MKKAITLIELIFTMVIIAVVFTVIPKIIYISNKSLEFSKKEDAIFNMMAEIMDISTKEYDEQNTKYDDILLTGQNNILECNVSTGYRIGGFKGSRNCVDGILESSIGPDSGEPPYDDVDDYNGYNETLSSYGRDRYDLNVKVGYTDQWNKYNGNTLDYTFTSTSNDNKTDIKRIEVSIKSVNSDQNISTVKYYSANIGHIKIESVRW